MADTKPFEENAIEEGDAPKEAKTIHRTKLQVAHPAGYALTFDAGMRANSTIMNLQKILGKLPATTPR